MTKQMTKRQIRTALIKARAHLVKYGWKQHDMGIPQRPCCALGAIRVVADNWASQLQIRDVLRKGIPKYTGMSISAYNDEEGRTKRQILGLFDKAINRLTREIEARK